MTELEELLRSKQRALDELQSRIGDRDHDMERRLREKEEELEIYKEGMKQTLEELVVRTSNPTIGELHASNYSLASPRDRRSATRSALVGPFEKTNRKYRFSVAEWCSASG